MVAIYYKDSLKIYKQSDAYFVTEASLPEIIWIDLNNATEEEKRHIETSLNIKFPDEETAEEIELSSRYIEMEDYIIINSNFLVESDDFFDNMVVSFILKGQTLVSYRNGDIRSFADTVRKFKVNHAAFTEGANFLFSLFEARIDLDADLLESLSAEISLMIKSIDPEAQVKAEELYRITRLQETTMILRENIIDTSRVLSNMLRSDRYLTSFSTKLRSLIKDVGSLNDHITFNFGRLEYLQNTLLGLINLEQNKIVKIFTVVSLIFMPPTLIASIYGMNFQIMPELAWGHGYYFALALMLGSMGLTLFIFRRRGWL